MASFGGRDPKLKCTQSRKNGKCMLQGYELKKIPVELLDPFNHLEGNELPQYVSMITKLNLCDNEITSIPDNVDGMGCELAVFEIRNNKLKVLPSTMSGLTGLKVIDASNNEIDEVQELDLPQLADMNLAKNLLSKLPNMSNLLSLSRLTLSNNKLSSLPDSIGEIPNLRHLIVDNNKLTSLPQFKSDSNKIETISIAFNQLTNLPESLNSCQCLTSLDVSTNKLTKWPSLPLPSNGKGGLISLILNNNKIPTMDGQDLLKIRHCLQTFQIANCGLTLLPPEIGAMRSLKTFNIESNELKDVPGTLGYLPELNALMTVGNPIRRKNLDHPNNKELLKYLRTKDDIYPLLAQDLAGGGEGGSSTVALSPIVAKKMREANHYGTLSLISTKVKSDQLSEFPTDIFKDPLASNLSEVIVTGHQDMLLFPYQEIQNLKKVVHLDLSGNGFIKATGSGSGDSMQFISIIANHLSTLSSLKLKNLGLNDKHFIMSNDDENFQLNKLREFDISNNNLTSFPTAFIMKCSKLEILTGAYNSMQGLNNDIPFIEKMKCLTNVDLSNNRLTEVGQLAYLQSLNILNVESNLIKTIPPEICLLKQLKSLMIGQNSIRSIPGDIINGGHVKLINFLKNRLPENYEEPTWVAEIKNQGKTSSGAASSRGAAETDNDDSSVQLDPNAQLTANLESLNKEILEIEALLETSMSSATKHATKKKLQIKKAERNRVDRQLKGK